MGTHTATTRGKQVIVILLDGTVIEDRFVERAKNNRWIVLQNHGRIPKSQIRAMSDKKGTTNYKRLRGK